MLIPCKELHWLRMNYQLLDVRYTSSFTLYHCELLCSCVGRDNEIEGTRVSGDMRNKHCVCSDMLH